MAAWTFITKHAVALSLIIGQPNITGRELADRMGVTERTVRKILTDLNSNGYIEKKRNGKGMNYRVIENLPLRQKSYRDVEVGSLLDLLRLDNSG